MVASYVADPTSLGSAIRRLREHSGMSQRALAEVSNVDRAYISMLESGARRNASEAIMRRLAGALGVTVGELYREAELFYPHEQTPDEAAVIRAQSPEQARIVRRMLRRFTPEQFAHLERVGRVIFLEGASPDDKPAGSDDDDQDPDQPQP